MPTPSIRIMPGALLRCANWPVETALAFSAAALRELALSVAGQEEQIKARSSSFIQALHAAVPLVGDRAARRYILLVKRHSYQHPTPFSEPPPGFYRHCATEPLRTLLQSELAARKQAADCRAQYCRLFDQTLFEQRAHLRAIALTDRFQKALLLANEPLWHLLSEHQVTGNHLPAKQRRLEATLFFYLMRAVGRPTPHQGWAGVASVRPEEDTTGCLRVEPDREVYQSTVALQPFMQALEALTRQPRYRGGYPLRLNPTLARTESGWVYERRQNDQHGLVEISSFPLAEILIDFFADGKPHGVDALLDSLATSRNIDRRVLEAVKNRLLEVDLLRVNMELPVETPTVWRALEAVLPGLLPADRPPWLAAVQQVQRACLRLEQTYNQSPVTAVRDSLAAVKIAVQQLWQHCGVAAALPNELVFVDVKVPFRGTWDATTRRGAAEAVGQWLAFHHAAGSAELYRQQTYAAAKSLAGAETSLLQALVHLSRQEPAPAPPPEPVHPYTRELVFTRFAGAATPEQLAAQLQPWLAWLEPAHRHHRLTVPASWARVLPEQWQCGSVLLPLWGQANWCIGPGRPQPGLFATRFSALLNQEPVAPDPLLEAIRQEFLTLSQSQIATVELFSADCVNCNAALRPPLASAALTIQQDRNLPAVKLLYDDDAHRIWLTEPDEAGSLPVYNSAAAMGQSSPTAHLLWLSAMTHGWEYLSYGILPVEREITTWHHCPRLLFADGTILSEERWIVAGETLRRLAQQPEQVRYLGWQEELRRRRIPDVVYARWSALEAPILLITSSPLALNSLFHKIKGDDPAWLMLSELPGDLHELPVRDAQQQHYIAELAVSWFYPGHPQRFHAHASSPQFERDHQS